MTCKEGTYRIAQQITRLLDNIEPHKYKQPISILNGTSLGKHFRHILDFYICLHNGLKTGVVDYSLRERNQIIETDRDTARNVFSILICNLDKIKEETILKVKADFGDPLDQGRPLVLSSAGRELMFAHDHAIHHLAMIKIGLENGFPEIYCDENLGVSPSTLKHEQQF